jgi:hypothetical protein
VLPATQSRTETGTRENPKLRDASRFTFERSNPARPVREDAAMGVGDEVLGRVVNFGFNRACNLKPQLAEFQAQGLPGNPQQAGGLVLTASSVLHHTGQQEAV